MEQDERAAADQCRAPIGWALVGLAGVLLLASSLRSSSGRPAFVWNTSPSSKIGLYRVHRLSLLKRGDTVIAFAPSAARRLAAERHYLPYDVPLVKVVAAVAGDRVCAYGSKVFINGTLVAKRLPHDAAGRSLPWWSGCETLAEGNAFLLSAAGPLAFDARYFGVSRTSELIGKADLVWEK